MTNEEMAKKQDESKLVNRAPEVGAANRAAKIAKVEAAMWEQLNFLSFDDRVAMLKKLLAFNEPAAAASARLRGTAP